MIWAVVILSIIVLDQLTKYAVIRNVGFGECIPIIDRFFYITYWKNKGAAWGVLQDGKYLFIPLTLVASVLMIYYLYKFKKCVHFSIPLSFVLGGAIGNLLDRVFRDGVVDFFDFYFGSYHFPTFNVADSFIVIGTFLLGYYILFLNDKLGQTDFKVGEQK